MQRAVFDTVDEVGRVAAAEGIEARYHRGGVLTLATAPEQLARVREEPEHYRRWGVRDDEIMWLDAGGGPRAHRRRRLLGGRYLTRCACLDPARLARGLARVVEKLGVTIYERTPVLPHRGRSRDVTAAGDVRAGVVVRATEGFTPDLPGARRELIPVYSLAIATEPLPPSFWGEVGWGGYETFTDGRHLYVCAMRTDDDRIVIGGRGRPLPLRLACARRVRAGAARARRPGGGAQAALPGGARRRR